ncbi:MAG: porin family protein [Gammaproteobacteria bacterium]
MKKALIGTALVSGMLLSTPTVMAGTGYIGLDYQMFRLVSEGIDDLQPEGAALRLGGSLSDNFMIEGRIGQSTGSDETDGVSLKVDDYMGLYLKAGVDVMDMLFPYVAAGFSKVDLTTDNDPSETEGGFSYGFGADVHLGNFQVGAEWMMMLDEADYELKTTSVSVAWRF